MSVSLDEAAIRMSEFVFNLCNIMQGQLDINNNWGSNSNINPDVDNLYDLGSMTYRWAHIYTNNITTFESGTMTIGSSAIINGLAKFKGGVLVSPIITDNIINFANGVQEDGWSYYYFANECSGQTYAIDSTDGPIIIYIPITAGFIANFVYISQNSVNPVFILSPIVFFDPPVNPLYGNFIVGSTFFLTDGDFIGAPNFAYPWDSNPFEEDTIGMLAFNLSNSDGPYGEGLADIPMAIPGDNVSINVINETTMLVKGYSYNPYGLIAI